MITDLAELHAMRRGLEQELDVFPNRTEDLKGMKRWERYPLMFYRTDLHVHGKRIASALIGASPWILEKLSDFNIEEAILLALVHDDAELVTGDFQSSNRVLMTKEELEALDHTKERAIVVMSERYPSHVAGFEYRTLLEDVLMARTPEAQVVKYFDKFEGFAEAMHEIYGGNLTFFDRPSTEYGTPPNPFEYYGEMFPHMGEKYSASAPLIESDRPFFDPDFANDWEHAGREGKLHTIESLHSPKGFQPYDSWTKALLASEDEEIISSLIVAKEASSN